MTRCRNAAGITYVEILLALTLFLIVSAGVLGSYLAMHQVAEHATATMVAVRHVDGIAERIYATDFNNVQTTFPAGVADGGAGKPYATIVGGYTLQDEHITITYPTQTTERLDILVTLNWTYRQRARTTQVSTVRTRG